MSPVKTKKQRVYQTTDALTFLETAEALKMSYRDLSRELGFTDGAGKHWVDIGRMPKVASIACEALRKRVATPGDTLGKSMLVVELDNGRAQRTRVFDLASVNEAKVGNQTYYLIPKTVA